MLKQAKCTFHGIGQGLFYSCEIKNGGRSHVVIYDCGTLNAKDNEILEREIKGLGTSWDLNESKEIDILFISHLDKDHISGIPYLMKNYPVKNVFIPYFSPEEIFIFAIENKVYRDNKLIEIYTDPVAYFLQFGCRVYIQYPQDWRETGNFERNIIEGQDRQDDETFIIEGDYAIDRGNPEITHCFGEIGFTYRDKIWKFDTYNDQTAEKKKALRKAIHDALRYEIVNWLYELHSIVFNMGLQDRVRGIYRDEVRYGINQSSLQLLHYPLFAADLTITGSDGSESLRDRFDNGYDKNTATLLTGDINLNRLEHGGRGYLDWAAGDLRDDESRNKIGVIQLPHHGAGGSMNVSFLKEMKNNERGSVLFVCSYKRNNKFGHPDPYVLNELAAEMSSPVKHVVVGESCLYEITATPL